MPDVIRSTNFSSSCWIFITQSPTSWTFDTQHKTVHIPSPDIDENNSPKRKYFIPPIDPICNARAHFILKCLQKNSGSEKKVKVAHTRLLVPELIPVLVSQPAGDVSHKPGGRLPLLSARLAVTPATLKRAATNFAAWWTEAQWVWAVCLRLLPDSVATAIWTRALLRLSLAR